MQGVAFDAKCSARIARVGNHVLSGHAISHADADWLFGLEDTADILELMSWATRVREKHRGNQVQLCSIVNAKAGACPEDCKFCAQSAHYQTDAPRYGFIEPEPMFEAAAEAKRNGVAALGLVAAWRGLREGPVLDEVCERISQLARDGRVRADASLGIIQSQQVADRLKAAGLVCYNHNLETSRRYFPQQCSTHSYDDRLATLQHLKAAGIKVCSGGILGLGETREDRCDLAFALRDAGADVVPINVLNPIPGTPYEGNTPLAPFEVLKTIACFRLILPDREIILAGGRTVNLRDLQAMVFLAGASGLMVGNYLTTLNQPVEKDLQMIQDLGLQPRRGDRWPDSGAKELPHFAAEQPGG